jgi:hypothetical protein
MTTPTTTPGNGHESPARPLAEFWSQCLAQSGEQVQAVLDGMKEMMDPAALRRRWLEAVSQNLEQYMRTPAFLDGLRRNLEMTTQVKSLTEEWAAAFNRITGIPRMADVSALFERLKTGQEAILARLAAIERRLEALEGVRKYNDD